MLQNCRDGQLVVVRFGFGDSFAARGPEQAPVWNQRRRFR